MSAPVQSLSGSRGGQVFPAPLSAGNVVMERRFFRCLTCGRCMIAPAMPRTHSEMETYRAKFNEFRRQHAGCRRRPTVVCVEVYEDGYVVACPHCRTSRPLDLSSPTAGYDLAQFYLLHGHCAEGHGHAR